MRNHSLLVGLVDRFAHYTPKSLAQPDREKQENEGKAYLRTDLSNFDLASSVVLSFGQLGVLNSSLRAGRACSGVRKRQAWRSSESETRCDRGTAPATAMRVDRTRDGTRGVKVEANTEDDEEAIFVC